MTELSAHAAQRLLVATHAGEWAEHTAGLVNEPFHWEWYEIALMQSRLAVCAPREFGKSEVFSVMQTAHEALFVSGSWQWIFSDTLAQAKLILERIKSIVAAAAPHMMEKARKDEATDVIFSNWSRVQVAGRGQAVRGPHPDRIVGDDILSEESTATEYQRSKTNDWWFGTVAQMAHAGVERRLGFGRLHDRPETRTYQSTRIVLVGTPFHRRDLLMQMASNQIYHYRRYSAAFYASELVLPGSSMAVEIHPMPTVSGAPPRPDALGS